MKGDRRSLVDATILAVGAGVVSWVYLMQPYTSDTSLTSFARLVSISYPLMDVLFLALIARLLFSPGARTLPFYFLSAGLVTSTVADI